ncbi:unnamed protein product [Hydatigera taeniaeformis]|uniref:Uncharacterized protein n=1 Tax=Hydatigena taeniaeformis TaxID=6205 RepID=A0A3P7EJD4_HYDTA|nr:unnamed protein product [Hydatigera taeniaeformis]
MQECLLASKNRVCKFLDAEISRISARIEEKTGTKQPEVKVPFTTEADLKIRLKILRFGLDERRKKLKDCENTASTLATKLGSMKQEAQMKMVSLLEDLATCMEFQKKSYRDYRQQVESMRRDLDGMKVSSDDSGEVTIEERNQKLQTLAAKICAIKEEISQLDAQPVLACQQLEASQLEFAENLDRKTQEVLASQELRVENVKTKFNRVKELYAEEKHLQMERVRELEAEKTKYMEKLMCINRKLDRLGRQHLLRGAQGVYKWLMASFDVQEPEEAEEVDECVGKRCAFFCQEIKRLQQHNAWLEGNLKTAQTKSLSRQRINAIKMVLDRGGSQTTPTDVRRRNASRSMRPRPISVIETSTKSTAHPTALGNFTTPDQVDSQRRRMNFAKPALSQGPPAISATQRRLAYSQSLRERRNTNRISLTSHSFQRGTPTSASFSFRSPTPLIYTAFRSTKCTASRTFDCVD